MDDIADLGLEAVSALIRSRQVSPGEVIELALARIDALDPQLHAFISILGDRAGEQAQRAGDEIARGAWRGPLHGVPVALKDLIDTGFAPTTVGMPAFRQRVPARDATVVERLEAAGAIVIGKLAMTEGAYVAHHPDFPNPQNPWSESHWTGVSSSGSGVAVAAGLCFGALGSDTGGSIRFPSAACGVTGVKPTWGRVSRRGVFPLAETLDHVGPMARSAVDAAILLQAIAGYDPADPTSLPAPVEDYVARLGLGIDGIRIGIDDALLADCVAPEVGDAVMAMARVLEQHGATLTTLSLPPLDQVVDTFMTLSACEAALAHRATHADHGVTYGRELSALIEQGLATGGLAVAQAQIERLHFAGALAVLFADVDLIALPVMPIPVPALSAMPGIVADPSIGLARFTIPFDMSGSPTITLTAGFDSAGLPIGCQLVGPHLSEDLLLRAGYAFQQATDWHLRRPPLATAH